MWTRQYVRHGTRMGSQMQVLRSIGVSYLFTGRTFSFSVSWQCFSGGHDETGSLEQASSQTATHSIGTTENEITS